MIKSKIIASCLVNSSMFSSIQSAESAVADIFSKEFPDKNYNFWNHEIDEAIADNIIRNVGRASQINVKQFILDLD